MGKHLKPLSMKITKLNLVTKVNKMKTVIVTMMCMDLQCLKERKKNRKAS